MNYIDNDTFINGELIPLIDSEINSYLNDEIKFAETTSEIEDLMYTNCPDDLKDDIMHDIADLINECIDDYDIIESDECEDTLYALIDNEFEKCKNNTLALELESMEKDDFYEEYEEDVDF